MGKLVGNNFCIELIGFCVIKLHFLDWIYCVPRKGYSPTISTYYMEPPRPASVASSIRSAYSPHTITTVATGSTSSSDDAQLLYSFIKLRAESNSDPVNRMLAAQFEMFYKVHPDFKARLGAIRAKDFCRSFPDLFDIRNDGKAGKILNPE